MNMKIDLDAALEKFLKMQSKMQPKVQDMQEALSQAVVTGTAGNDLVQIKMSGRYNALSVTLSPQLLQEDKIIIEELIAAAINEAVRKVEVIIQNRFGELSGAIQSNLKDEIGVGELE